MWLGAFGKKRRSTSVGLRAVLGELYHATFVTPDGPRPGRELFAPVWQVVDRFQNVTVPQFEADAARRQIPALLRKRPGGDRLVTELDALEDPA